MLVTCVRAHASGYEVLPVAQRVHVEEEDRAKLLLGLIWLMRKKGNTEKRCVFSHTGIKL